MAAAEKELKAFLFKNLLPPCRSGAGARRARVPHRAKDLFDAYYADPRAMPDGWREGTRPGRTARAKARYVADFLAGMTDTYADQGIPALV